MCNTVPFQPGVHRVWRVMVVNITCHCSHLDVTCDLSTMCSFCLKFTKKKLLGRACNVEERLWLGAKSFPHHMACIQGWNENLNQFSCLKKWQWPGTRYLMTVNCSTRCAVVSMNWYTTMNAYNAEKSKKSHILWHFWPLFTVVCDLWWNHYFPKFRATCDMWPVTEHLVEMVQ